MNRKGQYEIPLYIFGLILIFIYLLILFIFSFVVGSFGETLEEVSFTDTQINLVSYLRSPVLFLGENFTMQELLVYSYYTEDYSIFDEETNKIFNELYPKKESCVTWNMHIFLQPDRKEVHSIVNLQRGIDLGFVDLSEEPLSSASITIPLIIQDKTLTLRMVEVC